MNGIDQTPVRLCLEGQEDIFVWMDQGEASVLASACQGNMPVEIHTKDDAGVPLPPRRVMVHRALVKLNLGAMWRRGRWHANIEVVIIGKEY